MNTSEHRRMDPASYLFLQSTPRRRNGSMVRTIQRVHHSPSKTPRLALPNLLALLGAPVHSAACELAQSLSSRHSEPKAMFVRAQLTNLSTVCRALEPLVLSRRKRECRSPSQNDCPLHPPSGVDSPNTVANVDEMKTRCNRIATTTDKTSSAKSSGPPKIMTSVPSQRKVAELARQICSSQRRRRQRLLHPTATPRRQRGANMADNSAADF